MNQATEVQLTTVRLPSAVRDQLLQWASYNMTSMSAEILRSIRERAEREVTATGAR